MSLKISKQESAPAPTDVQPDFRKRLAAALDTNQQPESLPARVKLSFRQLAESTTALNKASDKFSKLVGEVEALLKPLNIGLECWARMGRWGSPQGSGYWEVGYAKTAGKWGIAIRSVVEDPFDDEIETWTFGDAPRRLRLNAVDYIPALLDELAKQAVESTKDIDQKTAQVSQLVTALRESATE